MVRLIKEINHSIAFTNEQGTIYINKNLKGTLRDKILKHELSHSIGKYNKHDFEIDKNNDIKYNELLGFCFKHPLGFVQYLPIIIIDNQILVSWIGILKIIFVLTIGALLWTLTKTIF